MNRYFFKHLRNVSQAWQVVFKDYIYQNTREIKIIRKKLYASCGVMCAGAWFIILDSLSFVVYIKLVISLWKRWYSIFFFYYLCYIIRNKYYSFSYLVSSLLLLFISCIALKSKFRRKNINLTFKPKTQHVKNTLKQNGFKWQNLIQLRNISQLQSWAKYFGL